MTVRRQINRVLIFFCSDFIIGNLHNVSDTSDCADDGVDLQVMELAPQEGNIYFYVVVFGVGVKSPDLRCDLVFFKYLVGIVHEKFHKLHFFSGNLHAFFRMRVGEFTGGGVKGEITHDKL